MMIINKFLEEEDYKYVSFQSIRKDFEFIYKKVLKKSTHYSGSKNPSQTKMHWSRDWEYPWAIINSEVKAGERVLDCGCGGSPLLPLLSKYGCLAYGVDPFLFKMNSALKYYINLIKQYKKLIKPFILRFIKSKMAVSNNFKQKLKDHQKKSNLNSSLTQPPFKEKKKRLYSTNSIFQFIKNLIKKFINPSIFRLKKNNLKRFRKDPNKYGFRIGFYKDSLDDMHFKDGFFDKVYCISVIEHLSEKLSQRGIREMARVLKKGGLLIITLDLDGIRPSKVKYEELIKFSGLELYGPKDFKIPKPENVPGLYNVVGFILKK